MRATFRPLQWVGAQTPPEKRRSRWAFKAPWQSTLDLLDSELQKLSAEELVIEADFREQDLRIDGMPRANARQPEFPGVRIAFDSKHGPLLYQTDAYDFWQHNVRAIALSLEALRSVDRYGVTKRAEQYTGWRAITAGAEVASSAEEAEAFLIAESSLPPGSPLRSHYRLLALRWHPDNQDTANAAKFQQLQEAKAVLGL